MIGVILAGGQARRMGGGDKGRLMLGGQSLLERVMARLGPQVEGLVLNANGAPERFADLGLPVIGDSIAGFPGPLAGVLAGLEYGARMGHRAVISAAADTPFFPLDLAARLQAAAGSSGLALAATREGARTWAQPTFGLWPVDLRADLRAALEGGLRKVVTWTEAHGAGQALFDTAGGDPFFNINTAEDLAKAEALL